MHQATRFMLAIISSMLWTFPGKLQAQNEPDGAPEMPPARAIPGITAEDQFPGACVDCHINYTDIDLDTRFSTLMARWSNEVEAGLLEVAQAVAGPGLQLTGVHPSVDAMLNDIPAGCFLCHRRGANDVVPLVPLLHRIHLGRGDEAVFLRVFQGECTHCHKLDSTTGQWQVPSGPER